MPGDGAGRSGRCPAAESKFVVIQRAPRDPLTVVDAISRALVMIAFDLDGTLSAPGRLQAGPGPVISCGCDRADQQHHGHQPAGVEPQDRDGPRGRVDSGCRRKRKPERQR